MVTFKVTGIVIEHNMVRSTILTLAIACILPIAANAQPPQQQKPESILAGAEQYLRKGEACYAAGDMECARREFDRAIDHILESGVDVRSDERLQVGWRAIVEKINAYQVAAVTSARGWRMQEYEGRPPQEDVAATNAEQLARLDGPLTPAEFQRQFSELRKLFQEKYGREIVLTGADHGEHRRLYGRGSAYDIRVRDLTREQVRYIIATGNRLGLRIKDFSTWDRVASHNARTVSLGRPLDTLATGLHLHIDRMVAPAKGKMASRPVIKKQERKLLQNNN